MKTFRSTSDKLNDEFRLKALALIDEGYEFHHSSISRGYHPVSSISKYAYKGKFGEGFELHLPTLISSVNSNRWHRIYYFIKIK